jgi:ABC-2 type transport system permease protein
MRKTLSLAQRELEAYFFSPIAYIVGAFFLAASSAVFFWGLSWLDLKPIFKPGNEASLRPLFEAMAYIMIITVPLLTMRLLSEEFHSGTIETLMTAPVTDTQVVVGKFLGVMGFYVALLGGTLVFLCLIIAFGQPDPGVVVMGYLGMLLLGAAFASVGLFTSALTRHQLLAAIVGIAILSVFALLMQVIVRYSTSPWNHIAARLNAMTYFKDFARGVFDSRGLVFFLSATALFLFLSVKTLESRRWR